MKVRFAATLLASGTMAMSLAACTTPSTMLRNPQTGQVVSCGGNTSSSLAGGLIGYSIQQGSDQKCVQDYAAQGFVPVH